MQLSHRNEQQKLQEAILAFPRLYSQFIKLQLGEMVTLLVRTAPRNQTGT